MPHILRTRIQKEIICEFLPPVTHGAKALVSTQKVIMLCGGMPSYPGGKTDVAEFLAAQGYWVFIPRYRGSWESAGQFLKISPHQDVIDVIDQLPKGFRDLWSGKTHKIEHAEIYIVGSSFGGAAAILASRDLRVKKVVALSPVIDWRVESKEESINALRIFAKNAFGAAYRFNEKDWNKLKTGKFYNPMHEAESIDGKKLLIIHAKDDKIVYARTSIRFAKMTGGKLKLLDRGGHFSLSKIIVPNVWKEIKGFLK